MRKQLLAEIETEATFLLSNLIKIDTSNPPGNELPAANFIAKDFNKEGFECEVIESSPGRGNILTRLKGARRKPSLLLLSHLDVVPANSEEWSVNPFEGVVRDGFVWGRGALDMKSMVAIEVLTMKLLKRNNVKLKGDIIFAATADEEQGGLAGIDYLLRNHRSKILANYVLNEGGGLAIPIQNKNLYTIQTAEKGILWFKIIAKGIPGHGSIPNLADNAILRMNKAIEKLSAFHPPIVIVPTLKRFLNEIAKEDPSLKDYISRLLENPLQGDKVLDELAEKDKLLAEEIRPRIRMTITPTVIHGGTKENVIPSECEATFDCRILPGQTTHQALDLIRELLMAVGLDKIAFKIIQSNEPSESIFETPLYRIIKHVLREFEPTCNVIPLLMTGGTDSRFLRNEGSICYGFHPMLPEIASSKIIKREHGIDERISVENLVFGASVFYEVVKRFMSVQ